MTPFEKKESPYPPGQGATTDTNAISKDQFGNPITTKPPDKAGHAGDTYDPIIFDSPEETIAKERRAGKECYYDEMTKKIRTVDENGNIYGIMPATEGTINSYNPPNDPSSPIHFYSGREIAQQAEEQGKSVLLDMVTGGLRLGDASGKPDGLVPAPKVYPGASDASDDSGKRNSETNNPLGCVNLNKAIETINTLSESPPDKQPPMPSGRSVSPLPTIGNYSQNIPQYGGSGRQRITAAMLKNKILGSCGLLVKNGTIYRFDGRCYTALSEAEVKQLIATVCGDELNEYGRFEIVTGTLNFILSEPCIQVKSEVENHRIVTFLNGNLDTETGNFEGFKPELFTTHALQCGYIPTLQKTHCPIFDKFIWDITGGDRGISARIWEMLGYCLVPDIGAKKGFVLQGRKHSGKSLLCNFLESFFPLSAVSALDAHDFAKHFSLSELEGKALCVSSDMPDEPLSDRVVSNIKKLSGNDLISASKKYENNRQFRFGGKLILVSNHQILTKSNDDAFWDRFVAIPFPNTIPREQQDPNLITQLLPEKDSIATRAIAAYHELRNRRYMFSGDYLLNSGPFLLDSSETGGADMRPVIQNFLLQYFESASYNENTFMSDAHDMFESLVGTVPLNQFGLHFGNMAMGILGARKGKTRKKGEVNATSCLFGLRLKAKI